MAWRNNKAWGANIPDVPEDVKKQFQDKIDSGTCYVSLAVPLVDCECLYGVENPETKDPVQKEFWEDMQLFSVLCGMGIAIHETKPVLLVRNVYNDNAEPWNIPLCDLAFAPESSIETVKKVIAERVRLENLRKDINNLGRMFTDYASKGKHEAENIMSNLPSIAQIAYVNPLPKTASIAPSAMDKMNEFWDKIEVLQVNESQNWCPVLRVTKDHVVMKFNIETATRIARECDGMSVDLGKMCVEIGLMPSMNANIKCWVMSYAVYGTPKGELMHPHIRTTAAFHPTMPELIEGSVCTGSYEEAIREMCGKFDAIALVQLWKDFLTSCSESGWYADFFAWLPQETIKQFCRCHQYKWTKKEDEKCPKCGNLKPKGV